jgi:hypothetical protein
MAHHFNLPVVTDDSIFDTAPLCFSYEMNLPVSADTVWAGLIADRPLGWCRALNGRYTSKRPFGIGTVREVGVIGNLLKLRERFFIWDEENRRHAFYVDQTNLPLFSLFAEDYQVTPTADGCRFVWRFAMAGSKGLGPIFALSKPLTKRLLLDGLIRDTERYFNART